MKNFRLPFSPFALLWLFAAATVAVLSLLQTLEKSFYASQQQQTDVALVAEILANVSYDNDPRNDTFLLDPAAGTLSQTNLLGPGKRRTGYIARQQGAVSAIVLPAETLAGYNGSIQLLVGVTVEGEITGVRIVAHNETPRLGDRIELAFSDWVFNFNKRSLDNTAPGLWRLKNDGGEFDQFTGATITPRAVVDAVRNTLEFFTANRDVLLQMTGSAPPSPAIGRALIASPGITAVLGAMLQPLPLVILALLLALKNSLAKRQHPPSVLPSQNSAGSKRVRVTGKS